MICDKCGRQTSDVYPWIPTDQLKWSRRLKGCFCRDCYEGTIRLKVRYAVHDESSRGPTIREQIKPQTFIGGGRNAKFG